MAAAYWRQTADASVSTSLSEIEANLAAAITARSPVPARVYDGIQSTAPDVVVRLENVDFSFSHAGDSPREADAVPGIATARVSVFAYSEPGDPRLASLDGIVGAAVAAQGKGVSSGKTCLLRSVSSDVPQDAEKPSRVLEFSYDILYVEDPS